MIANNGVEVRLYQQKGKKQHHISKKINSTSIFSGSNTNSMSTQTASASAGRSDSTLRLMVHWVDGVEFITLIKDLRAAGAPEDGEGPVSVAKFMCHANVRRRHLADDQVDDRQAKRSRNDKRCPSTPGRTHLEIFGQRPEKAPGGRRAIHFVREHLWRPFLRQEAKSGRGLHAASSALEIEELRKFQQLWLESSTSESRIMTPLLMKMSNALKALNFQLSALAKLVLQFDGQLSYEEFADAGFAEELSLNELPPTVRDHLDAAVVGSRKYALLQRTSREVSRRRASLAGAPPCANHRPGCDWCTSSKSSTARARIRGTAMDNFIVPIESWNDQVTAAMLDLNQHFT